MSLNTCGIIFGMLISAGDLCFGDRNIHSYVVSVLPEVVVEIVPRS